MQSKKWSGRALVAAVMVGSVAGCDFISPVSSDPNAVPTATLNQLLVGAQVNTFFLEEAQPSRLASMWLQQMDGTDRQFRILAQYVYTEEEGETYPAAYTGGGLVDIRQGIAQAEEAGRTAYAGIFKVIEAHMMGMTASIYGDIEYSEAVNPEITTPVLDPQRSAYDAVLALLDQAIADLQGGVGAGPGAADLIYGGDYSKWAALANTLKARYNLHWVEVDGSSRYSAALAAAQQGILSSSGDMLAQHSTAATEANLFFQFLRDRSGYWSAGEFGVDLLQNRNDPRLSFYYSTGAGPFTGQFVGSPPGDPAGDPGTQASSLSATGYGASDYDFPMVTCAENNFIIAEAQSALAVDGAARTALDAALDCEASRKGVDLDAEKAANDALTGAALFTEIMTQKYISLFLNREVWNDYKRTCLPAVVPFNAAAGTTIPGRLFYASDSRQTNPNIPEPAQQPLRNANDPNPC